MSVLGVCLSLASALPATPVLFVPVSEFTLAWTHSIEKVRWEEDYRVRLDPHSGQPVLQAVQARVQGSGAGMEPAVDAHWRDGWYRYTPPGPNLQELRLMRSEFTPDYQWCTSGRCLDMSELIASDQGVTLARACFGQ